MDLQGYGAFPGANGGIIYTNHLYPIEPGGKLVSHDTDLHGVPLPFSKDKLLFYLWFNQPTTAVGFIDPPGVFSFGGHFYLPSTYFGTFYGGSDKYPTVAIGFLKEI